MHSHKEESKHAHVAKINQGNPFTIQVADLKKAINAYRATTKESFSKTKKCVVFFKKNHYDVDIIKQLHNFKALLKAHKQTQLDFAHCVALYVLLRNAEVKNVPAEVNALQPLIDCFAPHWDFLEPIHAFLTKQGKTVLQNTAHTIALIGEMEGIDKVRTLRQILNCDNYRPLLAFHRNFEELMKTSDKYDAIKKNKNKFIKTLLTNISDIVHVAQCLEYMQERNKFLRVIPEDLEALLSHPKLARGIFLMILRPCKYEQESIESFVNKHRADHEEKIDDATYHLDRKVVFFKAVNEVQQSEHIKAVPDQDAKESKHHKKTERTHRRHH